MIHSIRPLSNPNQYEKPCRSHGRQCGLFCSVCLNFLCDQCKDPHLTTGLVIHSSQIREFSICRGKQSLISPHHKEAVIKLFQNAIENLEEKFNAAMEMMSIYQQDDETELIKTLISPEALKVIDNLNDGMSMSNDEISQMTICKARLMDIMKNVKDIISFVQSKAQQLNSTSRFAKSLFEYNSLLDRGLKVVTNIGKSTILHSGSKVEPSFNVIKPNKFNLKKESIISKCLNGQKIVAGKLGVSIYKSFRVATLNISSNITKPTIKNTTNQLPNKNLDEQKIIVHPQKKLQTKKEAFKKMSPDEWWSQQHIQLCTKYKETDALMRIAKEISDNVSESSSITVIRL